jgi:hypothetical protein
MTYRVIIKPAGKGQFEYRVLGTLVQGRSHQPLLDACRQLKQMGADPLALAALYHDGSDQWTVRTTVGKGADTTVYDPPKGGGPRLVKFKAHPNA